MRTVELNLADLFRGGSAGGAPHSKARPIAEAQIEIMREAFEHYGKPCRFKPGDIVTPAPSSGYSDRGVPHLVLEVFDTPIRYFEPNDRTGIYGTEFGAYIDIRVLVLTEDGRTAPFCQESWQLIPYDPAAKAEEKPAGDWIVWGGGECPVGENTIVEVEFRDGSRDTGPSDEWNWIADGVSSDIVRYRVLS